MRRSLGQPFSGRSLTRVGALLIVVSLLASSLAAWELRAAADKDAWSSAHTIGVLVSEQTQDALQAVDLSLRDIQRAIAATSVATPDRARQILSNYEFHDLLSHRVATLPQVDAITIVGADGKIVSTSRSWPAAEIDLSDRDYYTYLRTHTGNNNYVSEAARNRATNERMIFLAQRLNGPDGSFLGLIAAQIPLKYFENLYSRIGLSEGAGLTLLRRDGLVLVQYPRPDGVDTVRMPEASPWYRAVQAGNGAYRSPGFLGTGKRFISVHPVTAYPVVVDATIAEADAFAHWRRQAGYIALGALCAVLCILLLFRTLVTQFRRLERQTIDLSQTEARLLLKSRMLESTLEHMDQGLIMVNPDREIAVYNRRVVEMFDLPPELMATHPPFADAEAYVRDNEQNAGVNADIRDLIRVAETHNRPCTYDRHGVDGRDIEVRSVPVTGGGFVRTYTDVTERKAAEERVRYLAHHDGLTRLANRVVLREHLERELSRRRRDEIWAVLCVDLDQFKYVNDTLGHSMGDLLLRTVAERLRGCVRDGEIVARLGGDEFAIVQAGTDQPAHASLLAERVIDVLGKPFDLDGHEVTIGASIGIAVSGGDGVDADTLLKHADMALYRAKADGRGVYRFFEPGMNAQAQARRALEIDLRAALANSEFELFFQPILNARTRVLSGFEALIRWWHPIRGLVSPAEFIPLAEEIGLIIPIGEWVLQDACRHAAEWPDDLKVAVNLSPVQFRSSNLVNATRAALVASRLLPSRVELEITESVLLQNSEATLGILHKLHDLGLRISMDDFGTGYSSLSYLRSFPFDKIKIDQSFIRDLNGTQDSLAIVHAIMDLSRTLGMSVTAEGVETSEQFAILQAEGCAEAQGYLFSAPLPGKDVPALIARLGAQVMETASPS